MNLNKNCAVWLCIFFMVGHKVFVEAGECVKRRLGLCKVLNLDPSSNENKISIRNFSQPQPDGFALKASIEINLAANKWSVEKNLIREMKRNVTYQLDNEATITITIGMYRNIDDGSDESYESIDIELGSKHYGLVKLLYYQRWNGTYKSSRQYNRYKPVLPAFPYTLHLEIAKKSTNLTFYIRTDSNMEPFLTQPLISRNGTIFMSDIKFKVPDSQRDLVVFYDCTQNNHCGTRYIDELFACRESFTSHDVHLKPLGFPKINDSKSNVMFDEFVVVKTGDVSTMTFRVDIKDHRLIQIDFRAQSIEAKLMEKDRTLKAARTKQWFDVPASPYAVRVLITNGTDNFLNISNIRGNLILSLNLCGEFPTLLDLISMGGKVYFDCIHLDNEKTIIEHIRRDSDIEKEKLIERSILKQCFNIDTHLFWECVKPIRLIERLRNRPRKFAPVFLLFPTQYNENGNNFSKTLVDIREYVSEPLMSYQHKFGISTEDWCEGGTVQPKLNAPDNIEEILTELKNNNVEISKIVEELRKSNVQNNITASNSENFINAILSELQSIKALLSERSFQNEHNATSVNKDVNLSLS